MTTLDMYIGTLNNENTKVNYRTDIKNMLDYVGKNETEIELADLLAWKTSMVNEGRSTATIARRIGSVKRYYQFLVDMDIVAKDPSKKLRAPKVLNKEEPTLTADEVRRIIDCATNPRDKAIVATLASTGMRISELINIKINDVHGHDITIVGKGNKRRMVHINDKTMGYLTTYLETRKDGIDNLFVSNGHSPMFPNSINRTLKRLAKKAGVQKNIHNHSLRHLWATSMLDNGVSLERIQLCMGHSDISVTTRYAKIRNAEQVVRETMEIEVF